MIEINLMWYKCDFKFQEKLVHELACPQTFQRFKILIAVVSVRKNIFPSASRGEGEVNSAGRLFEIDHFKFVFHRNLRLGAAAAKLAVNVSGIVHFQLLQLVVFFSGMV